MACLQKTNKEWLRDGRSKLADASTSRSISHDADDVGRSVSCSMAITTRSDFDCVHEVSTKSSAIDSKKNGLHSFSRDQKRPAFVLKSSTNTCPLSKRYNFAIWPAFSLLFSRQAPLWKDLSIGMLMKAIAPVITEKYGNRWRVKILNFGGI